MGATPLVYWPFVLFAFLAVIVAFRYVVKGPESDRGQPAVTVSHHQVSILNIEPAVMSSQDFIDFVKVIAAYRRPLPPPAGVIDGPASDLNSIREITPEEAEELRRQDALLAPPMQQGSASPEPMEGV